MTATTRAFNMTDVDIPFSWSGEGKLEFAKGNNK
jgi:hypothetical protein